MTNYKKTWDNPSYLQIQWKIPYKEKIIIIEPNIQLNKC
jgi:hypothetical protein